MAATDCWRQNWRSAGSSVSRASAPAACASDSMTRMWLDGPAPADFGSSKPDVGALASARMLAEATATERKAHIVVTAPSTEMVHTVLDAPSLDPPAQRATYAVPGRQTGDACASRARACRSSAESSESVSSMRMRSVACGCDSISPQTHRAVSRGNDRSTSSTASSGGALASPSPSLSGPPSPRRSLAASRLTQASSQAFTPRSSRQRRCSARSARSSAVSDRCCQYISP
mmetsp:Transcript_26524/g.89249  ORF Transcript_26524/g.89249 Transcript_26524/m.89249 type:complete len:231 (-) Transcript_26524:752-1444(-)